MPPKRKAKELENGLDAETPRRSSRRVTTEAKSKVVKEPAPQSPPALKTAKLKAKVVKKTQPEKPVIAAEKEEEQEDAVIEEVTPPKPTKKANAAVKPETTDVPEGGRQYWLMKAEPESRIERGHDISFSIDDLAGKTVPEPWDGIRAYPARNNIRAMKKGDLAFFYHSSCKIPAIVGTMEIVEEHTPDLSAHNPQAAYYDPKSKPEDPKWSVVHVTFKQKLKTPVTLKELKAWQTTKGHALENMQMLKLARLSVSKVSEGEWKFLVAEMAKNGDVIDQ